MSGKRFSENVSVFRKALKICLSDNEPEVRSVHNVRVRAHFWRWLQGFSALLLSAAIEPSVAVFRVPLSFGALFSRNDDRVVAAGSPARNKAPSGYG